MSKANDLLAAEFSTFTHEETGSQLVRTLSYSLPTDLVDHIQFVHPTVKYVPAVSLVLLIIKLSRISITSFAVIKTKAPKFKKLSSSGNLTSRAAPASCATSITPTCLQEEYGIPTAAGPSASSKIAVSGFIEQFANEADLKVHVHSIISFTLFLKSL